MGDSSRFNKIKEVESFPKETEMELYESENWVSLKHLLKDHTRFEPGLAFDAWKKTLGISEDK